MRGVLWAAGAPDEKGHYHNDTSNYTVIRIPLRLAMVRGALPLDNMIQETMAARRHLTLSPGATQLKPSPLNSRIYDVPCTILHMLQGKAVKTSNTVGTGVREGLSVGPPLPIA